MSEPDSSLVLSVRDLTVSYRAGRNQITVLNKLNLDIRKSEIVGMVGESGSGKSTLGLAIIRLLQTPPAETNSGEIVFQGTDILTLDDSEMGHVRGTGIFMIFQEPMSSLDPVYTVGEQVTESLEAVHNKKLKPHKPFMADGPNRKPETVPSVKRVFGTQILKTKDKNNYSSEVLQVLGKVQIADPERVVDKYPHELSGGMAQRTIIAEALIERPALLIADEPTSALDVTIQAQVLNLLKNLRDEIGASILFITHDLAVAAQVADSIAVLYSGEVVETAETAALFREPLHPYTEGLIHSFPHRYKEEGMLESVMGDVPDFRHPPSGCRFHPRCKYAFDRCSKERPELIAAKEGRRVACFLHYSDEGPRSQGKAL